MSGVWPLEGRVSLCEHDIQSERKVTKPIPDACSIYQKANHIEIRKYNLYQVLEMSTAFSDACIHSFPHV
jgi:hypothetical protein